MSSEHNLNHVLRGHAEQPHQLHMMQVGGFAVRKASWIQRAMRATYSASMRPADVFPASITYKMLGSMFSSLGVAHLLREEDLHIHWHIG